MERLADKIVRSLELDEVNHEETEFYYYGIKEGLHILINIITMILVGVLVGKIAECVCFYLSYMLLRIYAGGYHADTRLRCYLLSSAMLVIFLVTVDIVKNNLTVSLVVMSVAAVVVVCMAPVENVNHRLDDKECKIFGKATRVLLGIYIVAVMMGYYIGWQVITACLVETIMWVAVMLVSGWIKYQYIKRE